MNEKNESNNGYKSSTLLSTFTNLGRVRLQSFYAPSLYRLHGRSDNGLNQ